MKKGNVKRHKVSEKRGKVKGDEIFMKDETASKRGKICLFLLLFWATFHLPSVFFRECYSFLITVLRASMRQWNVCTESRWDAMYASWFLLENVLFLILYFHRKTARGEQLHHQRETRRARESEQEWFIETHAKLMSETPLTDDGYVSAQLRRAA